MEPREALPREAPAVRPAILVTALLVVVAGVYGKSVDGPFVWDDRALIVDNPLVREAHALREYLAPFWNDPFDPDVGRAFFRPLTVLSYRLDWAVLGPSPVGFHATNVVLHAANAALVYAWARRTGVRLGAAVTAALLWALFPRLTESVCWVSGRTDLMAASCALAAMCVWPREVANKGRWLRVAAASALLLAGVLAKEVALAALLAIVAGDLLHLGRKALHPGRMSPLLGVVALYGVLRAHALAGQSVVSTFEHPSRLYLALSTAGTYLEMLIDPRPNAQIGLATSPTVPSALLGALAVGLVGGYAVWIWRRRDAASAAPAVLACAAMAPVLHVVPLPTSVLAADRFLYLPAAGIAVAAALALQDVGGRLRRGLVPVAAATALLYAGCSWSRCDVWRSELGFWLTTVEQAPARAVVPMIELGNVLYRANRFEDAARIARAITPAAGPLEGILGRRVAANLAASSSQAGRYDVARAIRLDLLRLDPASPKRHFDLGLIELHAQRLPQAVASFQRACDLAPEYPDGREGLALALVVSDMPVAARGAPSTLERAEWLTRIGARAEAEEAWVSALGAPRLSRDGLLEGASFLVRRGGAGAAAQAVARVREVAPEAAPAFEVSLAERQAAEDAILAAQPRLSAAIAAFDGS